MTNQTILETADAPNTYTPLYVLAPGDSFKGSLHTNFDADYVAVTVEAGKTYVVTAIPDRSLWAADLNLLGEGYGSILRMTAPDPETPAQIKFQSDVTGLLYVSADLENQGVGGYTVTFDEAPEFAPWALPEIVDYLVTGFWIDRDETPARWDFSDQDGTQILTYDARQLGDTGEAAAAAAFAVWSDFSNLQFVPTTDSPDITFTQGGILAYATHEETDGVFTSATINMFETGFEQNQSPWQDRTKIWAEYEVLVHEIGHVLGLGHGGPYNFFGDYHYDALHAADTVRTSVMSYFRPDEQAFIDMWDDDVLTPMPADILAIERLYGGRIVNAGDTIYGNTPPNVDPSQLPEGTVGRYLAGRSGAGDDSFAAGSRLIFAIDDDGGTDTIDISSGWLGGILDLTVPYADQVGIANQTVVLTPGTIIENARGSATKDTIIGNYVSNTLVGNNGDDVIWGMAGPDVVRGDDGNDRLIGGAGADVVLGGAGDDTLWGDDENALATRDEFAQVYRLYLALLGRAPDQSSHEEWINRLVEGSISGLEIAQQFSESREFAARYGNLSDDQFVERMYLNVFDRAPLEKGRATWLDFLTSGGSRADMASRFADSREFIQNTADTTINALFETIAQDWTAAVYRLYQTTLDRAPDLRGLKAWSDAIANGMTLTDAAGRFSTSIEFQTTYSGLDDEGFVRLMYRNVLDRDATDTEVTAWLAEDAPAQTRAEIVYAFSESREFKKSTQADTIAWVRAQGWNDRLDAGFGANDLIGGAMADRFIFHAPQEEGPIRTPRAQHTVVDFEAWDALVFQGFGFVAKSQVTDNLTQTGNDLMFQNRGISVLLVDTDKADITNDMIFI